MKFLCSLIILLLMYIGCAFAQQLEQSTLDTTSNVTFSKAQSNISNGGDANTLGTCQCPFSTIQPPNYILTPTSTMQISPSIHAGEYLVLAVILGNQYEFSLCPTDGASVSTIFDPRFNLFDGQGNYIMCNADFCGPTVGGYPNAFPKITFTATYTGTVRLQVNEFIPQGGACNSNMVNCYIAYREISSGGGGTGGGCTISVSPSSASIPAAGANNNSFNAATSGNCSPLTYSYSSNWIYGISNNGGIFTYSITANNSTSPRSGDITITDASGGSSTFSIDQDGVSIPPCSASASPSNYSAAAAGGVTTFNISSGNGACIFNTTAAVPWLSISQSNNIVTVTIDANPDPIARSGNVEIVDAATQLPQGTFTVTQNGVPCILPTIVTQPPATLTATSGNTVGMSVSITPGVGTQPITYQWKLNGTDIAGANFPYYTTPALALSNSGDVYTCELSNCAGLVTSSGLVVTVLPPCNPGSINTQPVSVTKLAGNTATFSIVAAGTPPFGYSWKRDGVAIAGATSDTYTTAPLTMADDQVAITCEVTNCSTSVVSSSPAYITVQQLLSVNPINVSLGYQAGAATTVALVSSFSWTAIASASWIDVTPASGAGSATVTISANSDNTALTPRQATVTFTSGTQTVTLTVVQQPNVVPNNCNAPTPLLPRSGIADIDPATPFIWTAVPGATTYEIEIAYYGASSPLAGYPKAVSAARYVPSSPLGFGANYQWRVRVQGGAWSVAQGFSTMLAPTISSPGVLGSYLGQKDGVSVYENVAGACQVCSGSCCNMVYSGIGQNAPTGLTWKDTEFGARYWYSRYALLPSKVGLSGDAAAYWNLGEGSGLIKIENGANGVAGKPQVGDLVVWQNVGGTPSKMAVVVGVNATTIDVAQQDAPTIIASIPMTYGNVPPMIGFSLGGNANLPCAGWLRLKPAALSPAQGDVVGVRKPTFSWQAKSNSMSYEKYWISVEEKDSSSGCYMPLFNLSCTSNSYDMGTTNVMLTPGREYRWSLASQMKDQPNTLSIMTTVQDTFIYFSVDPNAQRTAPAKSLEIHAVNALMPTKIVGNARVFLKHDGGWAFVGRTHENGSLFLYDNAASTADSLYVDARGYAPARILLSAGNITSENVEVGLQPMPSPYEIYNPEIVLLNGFPGGYLTDSVALVKITAKNHDSYDLPIYGDSETQWMAHPAANDLQSVPLKDGNNTISVRYTNVWGDTLTYSQIFRYIPKDSMPLESYWIRIEPNAYASGADLYVDGNEVMALSGSSCDSVRVLSGSHKLTAKKPGFVPFTESFHAADTMLLPWSKVVAIEKPITIVDFSVVPNPSSGSFVIEFTEPIAQNTDVDVFDMAGKLVLHKAVLAGNTRCEFTDLSISDGVYSIRMMGADGNTSTKKLVIQRH